MPVRRTLPFTLAAALGFTALALNAAQANDIAVFRDVLKRELEPEESNGIILHFALGDFGDCDCHPRQPDARSYQERAELVASECSPVGLLSRLWFGLFLYGQAADEEPGTRANQLMQSGFPR